MGCAVRIDGAIDCVSWLCFYFGEHTKFFCLNKIIWKLELFALLSCPMLLPSVGDAHTREYVSIAKEWSRLGLRETSVSLKTFDHVHD